MRSSGFIFRDPLTAEQIEAEFGPDFDAEDFQVIRFTPADSVLTGIEAHTDIHVTDNVIAEVGAGFILLSAWRRVVIQD